jgi:hypothetical protein
VSVVSVTGHVRDHLRSREVILDHCHVSELHASFKRLQLRCERWRMNSVQGWEMLSSKIRSDRFDV